MSALPSLQRRFQDYLFGAENGFPDLVREGAHASKPVMLGVYRHAYLSRLVDLLRHDYPKLNLLVGDDEFDRLARAYIVRHPSRHASARWVGDGLAEFLRFAEPYAGQPALAAMTAFEWAQITAFDAADRPLAEAADLAAVPPHGWPAVRFSLHPSVQRLAIPAAVVEAWERLHRGETAPAPAALGDATPWVVWRQGLEVRYRPLPPDEAEALDRAADGADFAALCDGLAARLGEDRAACRAAEILQGWIGSGMLGELIYTADSSS